MSFGIYVHIPYCVQRCTYCDFATYEATSIQPPEEYVQWLFEEIRQKHLYFSSEFASKKLTSLYFGGGTPSLIPPLLIVSIIKELEKYGFQLGPETETTIEINPYTITEDKLKIYLDAGINRFSVGAQTFDNKLLKMVKREHNAQQTLDTLALLRKNNLNFNFDLLFALPHQTLDGLIQDLRITLDQGASHISPYCLTVPEKHILTAHRPPENDQVEMFMAVEEYLMGGGFKAYEISNYALPGKESQHNLLYWTDQPYWGLGLSSSSYIKSEPWGTRFWNLSNINSYQEQISRNQGCLFKKPEEQLPFEQVEVLKKNQALTDFFHTSLRIKQGVCASTLSEKFFGGGPIPPKIREDIQSLVDRNLLEITPRGWALTKGGVLISNQVFEIFTFLESDSSPFSIGKS